MFSLNLIRKPLKTTSFNSLIITDVRPTPDGLTDERINKTSPLFKL